MPARGLYCWYCYVTHGKFNTYGYDTFVLELPGDVRDLKNFRYVPRNLSRLRTQDMENNVAHKTCIRLNYIHGILNNSKYLAMQDTVLNT
jgi:hypothetical protein